MRVRRGDFQSVILLLIAGAAAVSCAPPLLAPDEQRSQYDRYDTIRNQHADQYIFNEWGSREPNLRGRLAPKQ